MYKKLIKKAMLLGVCHRLSKLTSFDEISKIKTIDQLCPMHAAALTKAGLLKDNNFLALKEFLMKKYKQKEQYSKRTIYFCIGFSEI